MVGVNSTGKDVEHVETFHECDASQHIEASALLTGAILTRLCRVNTGVIININNGPVPFRMACTGTVHAGSPEQLVHATPAVQV